MNTEEIEIFRDELLERFKPLELASVFREVLLAMKDRDVGWVTHLGRSPRHARTNPRHPTRSDGAAELAGERRLTEGKQRRTW
jgi:hypothetical protein